MALVKMVRDFPEVPGGNTTADIPEEAVNLAMDNGWRLSDKKADDKKADDKKADGKKPDSKVEDKVEDKKPDSKADNSSPKTAKRDA